MTHKMIIHDAKEVAGAFYEKNRSETFRKTWPKAEPFVEASWQHHVAFVRANYAELLTRPDVPDDDKERMYEALLDDAETNTSAGASEPIQIFRDTEAFHGDHKENLRTAETFGPGARSFKDKMRSSTALFPPTKH